MFHFEILKGSSFSIAGVRFPNLTGTTTTAIVRFPSGATASPSVTVTNTSTGTYTVTSTTTSWEVGTCILEITYTNSGGSSQTQKYTFNCVDPGVTSTQTSLVNGTTKLVVNTR